VKFIIFFLFFSSIFSQDYIDELIKAVSKGEVDSVLMVLPIIENDYPNNPSVMYLKGLLQTDGDKAMKLFSKLYNNHPGSDYGDDAVMKVAEYYYAAGLYIQASDWLKKMPLYYGRSEHIDRAVRLFLNSLIVSGFRDTAIFYSRVFERQFPNLNIDSKINTLINEFEKSNIMSKKYANEESSKSNDNLLNEKNINSSIKGNYTLQSGAFSVESNAESQKINLMIAGYDVRIKKMYRNNNVLFAVQIGSFDNKDEASKVRQEIKSKLDIDSIIINNN